MTQVHTFTSMADAKAAFEAGEITLDEYTDVAVALKGAEDKARSQQLRVLSIVRNEPGDVLRNGGMPLVNPRVTVTIGRSEKDAKVVSLAPQFWGPLLDAVAEIQAKL